MTDLMDVIRAEQAERFNPGKFRLRQTIPQDPRTPVVVRCASCKWHRKTTVGEMASVYAFHRETRHP